jgi:hypothetical protein
LGVINAQTAAAEFGRQKRANPQQLGLAAKRANHSKVDTPLIGATGTQAAGRVGHVAATNYCYYYRCLFCLSEQQHNALAHTHSSGCNRTGTGARTSNNHTQQKPPPQAVRSTAGDGTVSHTHAQGPRGCSTHTWQTTGEPAPSLATLLLCLPLSASICVPCLPPPRALTAPCVPASVPRLPGRGAGALGPLLALLAA